MQIYFNQIGLTDFNEQTKAFLRNAFPAVTFTFAPEINYQAEIIVSYPQPIKKLNLTDFPRLKVIHLLSVGYDELDIDYLKLRGIRLFNARATSSVAIAEYIIGQILNVNYNLTTYHDLQAQKIWRRHFTSIELDQSRVLILGAGAISLSLAARLKGFHAHITTYRQQQKIESNVDEVMTDLAEVKDALHTFDYIVLALPSTNETRNLLDASWFKAMNERALLINIARGDLVVEEDLIVALKENQIRGAILDVTRKEPLPMDSPLWELPNVVITPHISFYSNRYLDNVLSLFITNLNQYLAHLPIETEIRL